MAEKKMYYVDCEIAKQINGKVVWTGSFFHVGEHDRFINPKNKRIEFKYREGVYFAQIAITMLSSPFSPFNYDDTVYVDIYEIDGKLTSATPIPGSHGHRLLKTPLGGVAGHHFGDSGAHLNQGISSYVGNIQERISFKIFIFGDNWVGATCVIKEL